jgi:Tfp pilus assembly pilus retraction ATPase PilT
VLVTGPTGSGKSSTLAAIIDLINETHYYHIVTIEDPIEFLHTHKNSTIHQRELHSDTPSFAVALRAALRQAPKVILVGEMRDRETIEVALEAAETGHPRIIDIAHDRRVKNSRPHHRRLSKERREGDQNAYRAIVSLHRFAATDTAVRRKGQGRGD